MAAAHSSIGRLLKESGDPNPPAPDRSHCADDPSKHAAYLESLAGDEIITLDHKVTVPNKKNPAFSEISIDDNATVIAALKNSPQYIFWFLIVCLQENRADISKAVRDYLETSELHGKLKSLVASENEMLLIASYLKSFFEMRDSYTCYLILKNLGLFQVLFYEVDNTIENLVLADHVFYKKHFEKHKIPDLKNSKNLASALKIFENIYNTMAATTNGNLSHSFSQTIFGNPKVLKCQSIKVQNKKVSKSPGLKLISE